MNYKGSQDWGSLCKDSFRLNAYRWIENELANIRTHEFQVFAQEESSFRSACWKMDKCMQGIFNSFQRPESDQHRISHVHISIKLSMRSWELNNRHDRSSKRGCAGVHFVYKTRKDFPFISPHILSYCSDFPRFHACITGTKVLKG